MGNKKRMGFISYLNDDNTKREALIEILRFDQFLIQFKTNSGNIITLPLARVLKVKEKEEVKKDGESRIINK